MAFSIRTMFRRDAEASSEADFAPDPTTSCSASRGQNSELLEAAQREVLTPQAGSLCVQAGNLPRQPSGMPSVDGFTVRELMAILPSHITRTDALPMEQIVALPLGPIQASLSQGRPSLRLSQIVAACPALFQRPLWPAEDMEIALPYQKACRLVDLAPRQEPVASSLFQMQIQQATAKASAGNSKNSPFEGQPFQSAVPDFQEQPRPSNGHKAAGVGKHVSPFEVIQPPPAPQPSSPYYQPEYPAPAQPAPSHQNSPIASSPFQAVQAAGQSEWQKPEASPFQMIGQGQMQLPESKTPAASPFQISAQLPPGPGVGQPLAVFKQPSPFALASAPSEAPAPQPAWNPPAELIIPPHLPQTSAGPPSVAVHAVKSPFALHSPPAPVAPSPQGPQSPFVPLMPSATSQTGNLIESPFTLSRPQSQATHNPIKQQPPLAAPAGLGPKSPPPSGMLTGIPSGMLTGAPPQPWQSAPALASAAGPAFAPQLTAPVALPVHSAPPPIQPPQQIPTGPGKTPAFAMPSDDAALEHPKQPSFLPAGFPSPEASPPQKSPGMTTGTIQAHDEPKADGPPLPPILTAKMKQPLQPGPKTNQTARPTRPMENLLVPAGMNPPGMAFSPPDPTAIQQRPQTPQTFPQPPVLAAPAQRPLEHPQMAAAGEAIRMSLASMLRGLSIKQLGFDPVKVPAAVQVALPLREILPQLAGGSVSLPLDTVLAGLPEKFRPAFARAEADLRIPLPLGELFHLLPASALQKPTHLQEAPTAPKSFASLFGEKAEEGATRNLAPPVQAAPPASPAPQMAPDAALPAILAEVNKRAAQTTQLEKAETEGTSILQPLFAKSASAAAALPAQAEWVPSNRCEEVEPIIEPVAVPVVGLMIPEPIPAAAAFPPALAAALAAATAETPAAPALLVFEPISGPAANPVAQIQPAAPSGELKSAYMLDTDELGPAYRADQLSSAPPTYFKGREPLSSKPEPTDSMPEVSAPSANIATLIHTPPTVGAALVPGPAPAAAQLLEDLSFGYHQDAKQIALRAIFNTENTLAPQEVVDLSSRFEGIRACLVIADFGVTHSGRSEDSEEVRNFSNSSVEAHRNLMALAASLDMNQQGSFTLRSDKAVRSFFMEKGICLAVLHSEPAFRPGVRERLILVAQELSQMLA